MLINSHIAWQHSTMPLYRTLCCWAFVRVLRTPLVPAASTDAMAVFARYFVLAGFFFGLTLQTHPGAAVFIPALAVAFIVALRSRRACSALQRPMVRCWLPWSPIARCWSTT